MKYKASLDQTTKILTGIAIIILAYAIVRFGFLTHHHHVFRIGIISIVGLVLFACFLLAPQSYEVTNSDLIICRLGGDKEIGLSDIQEIRQTSRADLGWSIRVFGNGGFCGYSGLYYFSNIGWVWMHATQRTNYVLVLTKDGKKRIITPDDMGIVELVNGTLKGMGK
jgi:hypothetical protein